MRSLNTFPNPLRLVPWLLALAAVAPVHAIDPSRTISQYVRERWGPANGFPRGPVYSINQTPDGYLWIGTESGLFRFDGIRFVQMQSRIPKALAMTHVLGLTVDREGTLWARLRRPTLLRYRDGVFQDAISRPAGPGGAASAIALAADGGLLLWALQGEPSALTVRNGKFAMAAKPVDFSRSPVQAVAQTADGSIWVGTRDAGLFRLQGGKTHAVSEGLPDPKVNALVTAGDGQLWVGTDAGVVRWNGTKLTSEGIPRSLDGVQALSLAVDRDANLWVGTNSQGLIRVNANGAAALIDADRDSNDAVTAIFEDREGNLWFGSDGGLDRLRDSPFVTYSLAEGLPSDGSNPLLADAENRLWFAPVSGGVWWTRNGEHGHVDSDGLGRDVVYSFASGTDGVWAGRQRGGLTHLQTRGETVHARTYTRRDGLAQDSVYSVHQGRDGAVWAGTLSGGLSRFAEGRFTNYTTRDGLLSNTVTAIMDTADGAVWVATPIGISVLANAKWENYTEKHGVPPGGANCLLEDSAGVVWAGTTAGLAMLRGRKFQKPVAVPPALKEQILGLAEDRFGWFWIATAGHVLRVNRDALSQGTLRAEDVREFGPADGLRGTDGVRRHRSVVTDASGRVWFSLNRGISVVDPARIRKNAVPAIAHVQAVTADGKPVAMREAIRIPGGTRRVEFSYAGISLSVPERVRFRYLLEGLDQDWSEPVATREAIYTNLGPGPYRFRVMASNPDGVWSSNEATVRFAVEPLYWQTWWFRTLALGAVLLAGFAAYRYRLHLVTSQMNLRFEERLAERTRIAQELHDTLLQGFLSASMQVHVATDQLPDDSRVKPTLTRALQLMSQVIEEGRNAVRGLRSTKSASLDLEQAFARIQSEVAQPGGATEGARFQVIAAGDPRPLHPLLRDEVYRIGREALLNAFRHSGAETIEVELRYSAAELRMIVRDDGRGIDAETLASGRDGHWGLSGMRERAERIHAKLHVRSGAAAGTEVELAVPSGVAFQDHKAGSLAWLGGRFRRKAEGAGGEKKNGAHR